MKDRIEEILNDETIVDVKDRVDAIAKVIPLFTVPKDKYNDLSIRLQNVETEKTDLKTQFDELQKQHLSAEELQEAKIKELEKREAQIAKLESETAISKILAENGISEDNYGEEYKGIVADLIGADQNESIRKANSFVGILAKQKETVEKETTTKLLNNTPTPNSGAGEEERITKEDLDNMTYSEEMAFANENPELYAELSQ
ncbi:MAG: hypothetical protein HFH45_01320 [Bacilli bacterium]|jgi:hypothetical protein|nr:hypothetical protein [Bacilli bacterium]